VLLTAATTEAILAATAAAAAVEAAAEVDAVDARITGAPSVAPPVSESELLPDESSSSSSRESYMGLPPAAACAFACVCHRSHGNESSDAVGDSS
jgi:hypothetical protein